MVVARKAVPRRYWFWAYGLYIVFGVPFLYWAAGEITDPDAPLASMAREHVFLVAMILMIALVPVTVLIIHGLTVRRRRGDTTTPHKT